MEARSLTQLTTIPVAKRLEIIAEGLGLIAEHVTILHDDLLHMVEAGRPRGAAVVEGLAQEEAAKALILLDLVRMGWRDQALAQRQLKRFYDHLARGIYARVVEGRPADLAEVRRYVDMLRVSHYLDGPNDVDWIFRNRIMADREHSLYVDYLVSEGNRFWTTPASRDGYPQLRPAMVIRLAIALDRMGCLGLPGLQIIAKNWYEQVIQDDTHWQTVEAINHQIIGDADDAGVVKAEVSPQDVRLVLERWTFPLVGLDLGEVKVKSEELQEERDRWLAAQWQ